MPGSGYRSYAEQAQLYQDYINGVPGQARAARPGRSKHNHGLAMDLRYSDGGAWAHANAARFGLFFPMDDEPWHVELLGEHGQQTAHLPEDMQQFGIQYNLNYTGGEPASPEEVVANRLHAVMRIVGLDPVTQSEGVAVQPVMDPSMDVLSDSAAYTENTANAPEAQESFTDTPLDVIGGMFGGAAPVQEFSGNFTPGGANDPNGYGNYAYSQFGQYNWTDEDYAALIHLWNKESGNPQDTENVTWSPMADNPSSTAFGIAQFLDSTWAPFGPKTTDARKQIDYGMAYIARRYGNPRNALQFHLQNNWY